MTTQAIPQSIYIN